MIPATIVSPHSVNTLDRAAFCKSVREKRKQLQLNHHTNEKDDMNSSTENAFLTQMLQSSSSSATSSSVSSSLSISSLLRKGNYSSPASHRTVTSTLTNILPALLNGTLSSPRANSPSDMSTNLVSLNSPTSTNTTDTLVDMKCSTSLPVSPATHLFTNNQPYSSHNIDAVPTNTSPPRCRSYPMAALTKRSLSPTSTVSPTETTPVVQSFPSPTSYLLATASSCPSFASTTAIANTMILSASSSPDDIAPKIVRSASVKSCASDSGVSSSSPLSDNNIVHVFRTNQIEPNHQPPIITNSSRKRKSLAHFYDELNKDKKFSSEATVSSGFAMPTSTTNNNNNNNIPYSQQEALAFGYAQYALMHTLTQQFRANYPAAFFHAAAAASGYLSLPPSMMAAAAVAAAASANSNTNGNKSATAEKFRERRKQPPPESDNNNNHIHSTTSLNDQPYRRETYQTLLESSRLLGQQQQQQKLLKPVPIDLRKHNGTNRPIDSSPSSTNFRYSSSSSSAASPPSSPPCSSPPKEPNNDYVCIPKKLMPVIGARINDWLERNVNFSLSLSVIQDTLDNHKDKYLLLSRIWHRLLLTSMIENGFEIYVTKDLQITNDMLLSSSSSSSSPTITYPTENDVKQIESLISRGKTLEIDEIGFNLIREMIIYKEGKTLFNNLSGNLFEKAESQAQAKLITWCSTRPRYSKIVFFLCNIYQVKEDIFERLFCVGSMHQSTPIHTYLHRFLESSTAMDA